MEFIVAEEFGLALQEVRGEPGIDAPIWSKAASSSSPQIALPVSGQPTNRQGVACQSRHYVRLHEQLTAGYLVPVPSTMSALLSDQGYGSVPDRLSAFDRGTAAGAPGDCQHARDK